MSGGVVRGSDPEPLQKKPPKSTGNPYGSHGAKPLQKKSPKSTENPYRSRGAKPLQKQPPKGTGNHYGSHGPQPLQKSPPKVQETPTVAMVLRRCKKSLPKVNPYGSHGAKPLQKNPPKSTGNPYRSHGPKPLQKKPPKSTENPYGSHGPKSPSEQTSVAAVISVPILSQLGCRAGFRMGVTGRFDRFFLSVLVLLWTLLHRVTHCTPSLLETPCHQPPLRPGHFAVLVRLLGVHPFLRKILRNGAWAAVFDIGAEGHWPHTIPPSPTACNPPPPPPCPHARRASFQRRTRTLKRAPTSTLVLGSRRGGEI